LYEVLLGAWSNAARPIEALEVAAGGVVLKEVGGIECGEQKPERRSSAVTLASL
jgi:hypothetical protein